MTVLFGRLPKSIFCPWGGGFQAYQSPLQVKANCGLHSAAKGMEKIAFSNNQLRYNILLPLTLIHIEVPAVPAKSRTPAKLKSFHVSVITYFHPFHGRSVSSCATYRCIWESYVYLATYTTSLSSNWADCTHFIENEVSGSLTTNLPPNHNHSYFIELSIIESEKENRRLYFCRSLN